MTVVQDCNRKEGQAGEFEHYKDTDVEPWWLVGCTQLQLYVFGTREML